MDHYMSIDMIPIWPESFFKMMLLLMIFGQVDIHAAMYFRRCPKWISRKVVQTVAPISNWNNWTGELNMIQFSLRKRDLATPLLWVNDATRTCDLTNEPFDMLNYNCLRPDELGSLD